MNTDLFKDTLKKPSIFKDESKLDINFVPDRLPHRNKELSLLSQLFLTLLTNPNLVSRNILITGKTGIGKTVTVKYFGKMLENASKERGILIKYIHINCRKEHTSYRVLIKIIRTLDKSFPKRGYSPQDLLEIITDFLNVKNSHLLIVLDELSYLINSDNDLIYSLTRINDDSINMPQRLSIIGIVRDISCLNNLDISTLNSFQNTIIKFDPYTKKQIFEILKYRAEISLKQNAISDRLIKMISEIVHSKGDIRYGLNLIWKAGKISENLGLKTISSKCVDHVNQELASFSIMDVLKYMSSQKLIYLLAIVNALKKSPNIKISLVEILKFYHILCEKLGLTPRSHSQLWSYLQEYKKEGLILMCIQSRNIRGRRALIEINNVILPEFEKIITFLLNLKGTKIKISKQWDLRNLLKV